MLAALTGVGLVILIYIGSRGFQNFDAALIGYAVGTVFAAIGLVYRYTIWISRPPTWRCFRAGWADFLSFRNFRRYTLLIPKAWWTDIFGQTFILRRGLLRWVMHMSIFWGVILSLAVTVPLTFGWIHFTFVPPHSYKAWFFGFAIFTFPLHQVDSFPIFHVLDFTALLLIVGLTIALWRRITNAGLLATQRFGFDLLPLVLLFAIAVSGLALTASQMLWQGRFYWFISLSHQLIVVGWLLSLPFGKFFHIVERPATIGVTLYQTVEQDREAEAANGSGPPGRCPRCGEALPSRQFTEDLKATLKDLGQDYDLSEMGRLQDYCQTCKRVLRGQAYFQIMGKEFI